LKSLPSFALPLSIAVGVLVAVAALQGLFNQSIYAAEATSFAVQGRAQDLVTAVWVLPLYGVALYHLRRGSLAARLGWLGILLYFAYTYLLAAMGLAYNSLFLLYVAIYSLSLALLIVGLTCVHLSDLPWRFSLRFPRRAIAVFMMLVGVALAGLWLMEIVRSIAAGTPPAMLADTVTQSLVVQALDLGLIVPLSIVGAIALWRGTGLGYLLSGLVLTKAVTMGPALLSMAAFLSAAGLTVAAPMVAFAALVTAAGGYFAWRYVRLLG
jgi:hypothetical protein